MLLLLLRVAGDRYGLPARQVAELLPDLPLEPASGLGPAFAGVLAHRGRAVPVVDLCQRLAGRPARRLLSTRLVLVRDREGAPWALRAERAQLEVGGYGTARNTTFEVLGVPVLWLPWMIYPLKTERETGFLFPELGASTRSGGDYAFPFFWAVRHNVNLLLTPAYVSKRGFKPSARLEYVFGDRSEGEAYGSWIHDGEIDRDDPSTPFPQDRFALQWRHDHFLPHGWRFKADTRWVSDNLYVFDFDEFREERADRFLDSLGFVDRSWGAFRRLGLSLGARFADDLQSPDDTDRDDVLL
ncbi:MAG: LPS-assembly protein LptD, partial [Gammaproteobacteria bacterium]